MGTNKRTDNTRVRNQVQAYVRGLRGPRAKGSGWGTGSITLPLPKSASGSGTGGVPQSLPRQLEATATTKSVKNSANAGGGGIGNAWLLSPIASTVKSILSLFDGGGSTTQSTRFRSSGRRTFRTVEGISLQAGGGAQGLNESAAGLAGIVRHAVTGGAVVAKPPGSMGTSSGSTGGGRTQQFEDRQALVTALRRGLSESRGISDVLNDFQDGL